MPSLLPHDLETDSNNIIWVRLDRARKLCLTVLLRALGYESDAEIIELLGDDKRLVATLSRDNTLDEAAKGHGTTRRPRE